MQPTCFLSGARDTVSRVVRVEGWIDERIDGPNSVSFSKGVKWMLIVAIPFAFIVTAFVLVVSPDAGFFATFVVTIGVILVAETGVAALLLLNLYYYKGLFPRVVRLYAGKLSIETPAERTEVEASECRWYRGFASHDVAMPLSLRRCIIIVLPSRQGMRKVACGVTKETYRKWSEVLDTLAVLEGRRSLRGEVTLILLGLGSGIVCGFVAANALRELGLPAMLVRFAEGYLPGAAGALGAYIGAALGGSDFFIVSGWRVRSLIVLSFVVLAVRPAIKATNNLLIIAGILLGCSVISWSLVCLMSKLEHTLVWLETCIRRRFQRRSE